MDTEKYQALLQAVEQGSITAAARDLGYSPSGLTRMLDSLERDLGFSLLFRKKKGPPLRPAPQFMLAKRSTAFVKF